DRVKEAIMPRNKFKAPADIDGPVLSAEHFVRAGQIKNSQEVILATEFTPNWRIVSKNQDGTTSGACKSHRPVHGFLTTSGSSTDVCSVPLTSFGRSGGGVYQVKVSDMADRPDAIPAGGNYNTLLDRVGRNHGSIHTKVKFDDRKSNFLYVDGHVATKNIKETIEPKF